MDWTLDFLEVVATSNRLSVVGLMSIVPADCVWDFDDPAEGFEEELVSIALPRETFEIELAFVVVALPSDFPGGSGNVTETSPVCAGPLWEGEVRR